MFNVRRAGLYPTLHLHSELAVDVTWCTRYIRSLRYYDDNTHNIVIIYDITTSIILLLLFINLMQNGICLIQTIDNNL